MQETETVIVKLADGRKQETSRFVNINELHLGPYYTTKLSAQVIKLQRYDAILGKPWLYHTNPIIDWRTNKLIFQYGLKTIVLKVNFT